MRPRRPAGARGWRAARSARLQAENAENAESHLHNRRATLRFILTFAGVAGVLFSLYAFPYAERGRIQQWFGAYLAGYARLAGAVLSLFEAHVKVAGNVISGRGSLAIVKTCDAMEANLLFVAAVLALPAPWGRKAIAAVAGTALLVVVNVVRICSLYFVEIHFPHAFEVVHIEIWPLLLIAFATAEFAVWTIWMRRAPAAAPAPPAET